MCLDIKSKKGPAAEQFALVLPSNWCRLGGGVTSHTVGMVFHGRARPTSAPESFSASPFHSIHWLIILSCPMKITREEVVSEASGTLAIPRESRHRTGQRPCARWEPSDCPLPPRELTSD